MGKCSSQCDSGKKWGSIRNFTVPGYLEHKECFSAWTVWRSLLQLWKFLCSISLFDQVKNATMSRLQDRRPRSHQFFICPNSVRMWSVKTCHNWRKDRHARAAWYAVMNFIFGNDSLWCELTIYFFQFSNLMISMKIANKYLMATYVPFWRIIPLPSVQYKSSSHFFYTLVCDLTKNIMDQTGNSALK